MDGVAFERELLHSTTQPIDVLSSGPASNLALLLSQEPDLSSKIRAVYVLGDYVECQGYNCTTDKDGAKVLVKAGIPIYMLLAEQTDTAPFDTEFLESVKALTGPAGELVAGFMSTHANGSMKLWDDGVLATMLDPSLATYTGASDTYESSALDVQNLRSFLLELWDSPTASAP